MRQMTKNWQPKKIKKKLSKKLLLDQNQTQTYSLWVSSRFWWALEIANLSIFPVQPNMLATRAQGESSKRSDMEAFVICQTC